MLSNNEQDCEISGNIQTEIFTQKDNGYQAVKWFVTYHMNKENDSFEQSFERLKDLGELCDKYIFGEEYGKSGNTPHIQGAFILKKKMRASTIEKFFKNGVTLRKLKNWNCAFAYCQKEGNNILSNCKLIKPIKTIEKLDWWMEELLDVIKQEPDDRKIYWIWSDEGGVGKTSFQKYLVVNHSAIILGGKASDIRNGIVEYKKENMVTPDLICINIPRSFKSDYLSYEGFENIKDMCFYSGKYEGGMVVGNAPHLFIFANIEPDKEKMSSDRFIVWKIG